MGQIASAVARLTSAIAHEPIGVSLVAGELLRHASEGRLRDLPTVIRMLDGTWSDMTASP